MKELEVNPDIVNVNGGAIAIGHPIGMSGARITLHAALELARRGSGYAVAALCGGGGQGDALTAGPLAATTLCSSCVAGGHRQLFKYLGSPRTEMGVQGFGMAHGLVFIAFVVLALLAGIAFKWAAGTWLLELLASIVPLCSVIFLDMGLTAPAGWAVTSAPAAIAQPGRYVPETT